MKYDVAAVEDRGDFFHVKYVDSYQNSVFKNDGKYVKVSNVAADVIREALSNNNRVCIPKNIEGEICFTDIIIYENDELEKNKMMFISNLYRKVDHSLFNVASIDYYDFLCVYSKLASLGYFITDDNREEKYIEIITTGDDDLINILEEYLNKKDKLDSISYVYSKTKLFEKKAIDCETQQELDAVKEEFEAETKFEFV